VEVPEMQVLQGHLEIQLGVAPVELILVVVEALVLMEMAILQLVAVKVDQESL
jgi:hypothetical protein